MAESAQFSRRGTKGGAARTNLAVDLSDAATTVSAASLSTWTGATTNGPATATIARGAPDEETIEFTGISSNDLTGVTRGVGGTAAVSHLAGATLELTSQVRDFDEANHLVNLILGVGSVVAGDQLYVSAASGGVPTALTRVGKGTAGQAWRMNSGATAPEWGTSGMEVIAETILGSAAASITFSSIPGTYRHLRLVYQLRSDRAGASTDVLLMRFNGDTGANYDWIEQLGNNVTGSVSNGIGASSIRTANITGATASSGFAAGGTIDIPNYAGTDFSTNVEQAGGMKATNAAADIFTDRHSGFWRSAAAITSVTLLPSAGPNFIAGSTVTLYGIAGA